MKPKNKQILLGGILGDNSIYIPKSCKNPMYSETHSIKQKDYLLWKIGELSYDLGEFNTNEYENNGHTYISGWAGVNPLLKKFIDLGFEEISEDLSLLGFLVWYLDDGNFHYWNNDLLLSTKDYPNKSVIEWVKEKFGVEFEIKKENVLRLNVSDTEKLIPKLIDTFEEHNLPSCMEYKLGLDKERGKEAKEKKSKYLKKYYEKNRGTYKGKPNWTDEEIKILKNNYKDMTNKELSKKLDRTRQAINHKKHKLGLRKREPNWTDEEINILKNNYEDMTIRELSEILDRTKKSIYSKKYRLKKNWRG